MSENFERLMDLLQGRNAELERASVHGALTNVALSFDGIEEAPWLQTILGDEPDPETQALADAAVAEITTALRHGDFSPAIAEDEDYRRWCEGYVKMIALDDGAWTDFHETHLEIGKSYVVLTMMGRRDVYEEFSTPEHPSHQEFLHIQGPLLGPIIRKTALWRFSDEETLELFGEGNPIADWPEDEIRTLSNDELMERMTQYADCLSRTFIDECIRRGEPLAPLLKAHLSDERHWRGERSDGDWWAMLHAVHILGSIPGREAADTLLRVMRMMNPYPDDNLWDWLAPHWPQLFQNKRKEAAAGLEAIAFDSTNNPFMRYAALECLLEAAYANGADALDAMLDRIAAITADEQIDEMLRGLAGGLLLNFPRPRHRELLNTLARGFEQTMKWGLPFDLAYVEQCYEKGEEKRDWERFRHYLHFYDPVAILKRQKRWIEEDEREMERERRRIEQPYLRIEPKVGRNDPCPCGSGKKYKKCCLKN